MERMLLKFGILCLILMVGLPLFAGQDGLIRKVVIDPGHGGKDPGASGKSSYEKTIVLKVALKLGEMIKTAYPEVEVIYTRKNDQFIELHKRTEIANKHHADLFISIHCNANKNKQISGAETFVMGLHKTEQNLAVAKLENAAILQEDSYESAYEGFNPNSDEDHIALSMFQSAFLDQSLEFSGLVQDNLQSISSRANRGVKQAGFLVLARATMPAVLVELGFISNPNEEMYLSSDKGQQQLARSVFNAFSTYKSERAKSIAGSAQKEVPTPGSSDVDLNKSLSDKKEVQASASESKENKAENKTPDEKQNKKTGPENNPVPVASTIQKKTETSVKMGSKPASVKKEKEVVFRVQVHATRNRSSFNRKEMEKQYSVTEFQHNGYIKYAIGHEKSLSEANKLLAKLKGAGFPDAFVIAFVDGVLTNPSDAAKLVTGKKP